MRATKIKISVVSVLLLFSLHIPLQAEAGFFSFIEKIFTSEDKSVVPPLNAATMLLLAAPAGVNPSLDYKNNAVNIVDQNYLLADSGPLGTIADIDNMASTQVSLYTVREGDTVSEIAEMFKVNVNTIRWANDLDKGTVIQPGQQLVILPIPGILHTVQKGDNLSSIAKKFNSTRQEIIRFNDLDANEPFTPGQTIIIPNGELFEPAASAGPARKKSYAAGFVPSYSGYYLRPVKGGYKSQGIHGYNGIDLATDCGEPIFASAAGDVIISKSSGWNGGYGKYIVISHPNGTQTLYSHNSENTVTNGWHVAQGQIIGYVGKSGLATGCHVHFEIRGARNPF